jgi:DUF4097 and DUF4098 domain-containing protein YvlB
MKWITRLAVPFLFSIITVTPIKAAAEQKETEVVDRTVAFPDKGRLVVKNFSGNVRISGTSGKDVVVKATRRAEREQLDHIKLEVTASGSVVTVEANRRDPQWRDREKNVVETELEIQVPATATVEVDAFSSRLTVVGVTGSQRLKTFSGDIDVDAAAAGVSPELDVETFSGEIVARVSDKAQADVQFSSFSGSFESDVPVTLRSSNNRRRVSGSLGSGAGRTLRFHTFSGDVRVRR